jgi:endonuclease/exonuclease/phosphatase family metal-dependent hydrolase
MTAAIVSAFLIAATFQELKVMTYNIRYATAPDGVNVWSNRKQALLSLIKRHDPDVLGVQEALSSQIEVLRAALPEHDVLGVGRDDGLLKGEYSAIFTRRKTLGLREGGTRWISKDPQKPGSIGPGAKIPRVFVWGEFFLPDGRRILLMNCHLDHESAPARLLGAEQMRDFAASRSALPTVITGDFNCGPSQPPVQTLIGKGSFTNLMPAAGPFGTFTGFDSTKINGEMIDHIFVSPEWKEVEVAIDRKLENGRPPSDHFPVIARISLQP